MKFVLGIVIGLASGAGVVYWLMKQQVDRQQQEIQQGQRVLQEVSAAQEARKQELVASLEADYRKRLENETTALSQQHDATVQTLQQDIDRLKAELSDATAAPDIPAVVPAPTVAPPADVPAPPTAEPEEAIAPAESAPRSWQDMLAALDAYRRPAGVQQLTQQIYHPDATVRQQAAIAIGQFTAQRPVTGEVEQLIPTLATLSRDADPGVREAAVQSLSTIRSDKVIPLLEQSLRDTHGSVVKAASNAIAQYKSFRLASPPPLALQEKGDRPA